MMLRLCDSLSINTQDFKRHAFITHKKERQQHLAKKNEMKRKTKNKITK